MKVICSAKTDKKEIAISFDDGPVQKYTPDVLQILKTENVQAAFFCIGKHIKGNEKLLMQIHTEGHVVGNHSYSHHFWFDLYAAAAMLNDLKMMDAELKNVIDLTPKLFRPPYGVMNPNLKKAIIKGNYIPIGWNVRSLDTVIKDEKKLLQKIRKGIQPGAVFLFHDTSKTMLSILPQFIQEVKNRGYVITRLDKMLHLQPYA